MIFCNFFQILIIKGNWPVGLLIHIPALCWLSHSVPLNFYEINLCYYKYREAVRICPLINQSSTVQLSRIIWILKLIFESKWETQNYWPSMTRLMARVRALTNSPLDPKKKKLGDISINFNLDYQGPDYEYLKYRIVGTRPGRRRVNLRKNVLKKKKEKGNYIKQL